MDSSPTSACLPPGSHMSSLSASTSAHCVDPGMVTNHSTQPGHTYRFISPCRLYTNRPTFKPCSHLFCRRDTLAWSPNSANPLHVSRVGYHAYLHLMRAFHFASLLAYRLTLTCQQSPMHTFYHIDDMTTQTSIINTDLCWYQHSSNSMFATAKPYLHLH